MSIYKDHGYYNRADYLRADYLQDLAAETGVPLAVVHTIADLLGPNEDFDGLISAIEDCEMFSN